MRKAMTISRILMIGALYLLIVLPAVFSQVAQDRCENNRKQIAEYEAELRVLRMVTTDIHLRGLRQEYESLAVSEYKKELAPRWANKENRVTTASFLRLDWDPVADDVGDFQIKLRNKFGQLIDQIKREGFPARKERADWVEKQIGIHKNRLLDLKCNQPDDASSCSLAGRWSQNAPGVGPSTWVVTDGGEAKEEGLGGSTGTATLAGKTMTIEWSHKNGWSGTYRWTMDASCKKGTGQLIFKSGGSGTFQSTVTHN